MPSRPNSDTIAVLVLLGIGAAGLAWYWLTQRQPEPTAPVALPEPEIAEPSSPEGPRYPVAEEPGETERDLVELPPLSDSDAWFKLALADVFGEAVETLLVESGAIERIVATVDNLPREKLAERLRPAQPVGGAFAVEKNGDSLVLDDENYARYDAYVNTFLEADIEEIVSAYRRFYPLLQEAYVRLGYPDGYFNDRLIEVIDHLLETPDVSYPVRLERPHVLYVYADPDIEALSSGQKTLIRLGPEHASRIKSRLAVLRDRLAAPTP